MSILAHLSDLHLIERDHHKRRGLSRKRLQFLSFGAPLDAEARLTRATALLTYKQGVDAFRISDRLSDSDKAQLMGGTLSQIYGWSPGAKA